MKNGHVILCEIFLKIYDESNNWHWSSVVNVKSFSVSLYLSLCARVWGEWSVDVRAWWVRWR